MKNTQNCLFFLAEMILVRKKTPINLNLKIAVRFEDSHDCSNGEKITLLFILDKIPRFNVFKKRQCYVGCFVSIILEEGPNPCVLILAKIEQKK